MTTLREAVANLIKVKGRHNTEIAYQKLVEAFDADKPEQEPLPEKSKGALSHEENKRHNKMILDKFYKENAHLYTAPPKIFCGCGDQIMPDDGAECGTCVTARNAVKPDLAQVGEVGVWGERKWQGLTDEEIKQLWKDTPQLVGVYSYTDISREVEAKLKEKNT